MKNAYNKIKTYLRQYFCLHHGTMTETITHYSEVTGMPFIITKNHCTNCLKAVMPKIDPLLQQEYNMEYLKKITSLQALNYPQKNHLL